MRATVGRTLGAVYGLVLSMAVISCGEIDAVKQEDGQRSGSRESLSGQKLQDCPKLRHEGGDGKGAGEVVEEEVIEETVEEETVEGEVSGPDGREPVPGPCAPPDDEPGKPPKTGYPGQNPGQNPGQSPGQYPGQSPLPDGREPPVEKDRCGKNGHFCDRGGRVNWPGQTHGGRHYERDVIKGCLSAFHKAGYHTRGTWQLRVKESQGVNVLSRSGVVDQGREHSIVILDSVNVLGQTHYQLMNPNALYCFKDVSVLEQIRITSCHQNNVVFGDEVNVLSSVRSEVVSCQ